MIYFICTFKFDFVPQEITPRFNALVMDPFASHVLRSLLLLLCPSVLPEDTARRSLRSKKSISWKAKQGRMKSIFSGEKGNETQVPSSSVPASFHDAAKQFLRMLRDGLSANEVRALAPHKVAGPVLQVSFLCLLLASSFKSQVNGLAFARNRSRSQLCRVPRLPHGSGPGRNDYGVSYVITSVLACSYGGHIGRR